MSSSSVRGPVVVEWRRENGTLVLECLIPPNSTATVYLPTTDSARVTESGVPAARVPHVKHLRDENGVAVYAVDSGSYRFVASQ